MKAKLTIYLLFLTTFLIAQDFNNITWDTLIVTDGDTTLFSVKGAPEYIDSLRVEIFKRLTQNFENQLAEDFDAVDMDNDKHSLYSYRGQVVVLYFWDVYEKSSWKEYVSFNKLYQNYSEHGVIILGLCNDDKENVNSFLTKREILYPNIPNCKEYGMTYYGGKHGNPRVFVIDKMGMIRHTIVGGSTIDGYAKYRELKLIIDDLLKE